ncbi:MAG: uroporphyrinogen-III synthase, partial [Acidimicrobiia bacterium]|nr:uroporphyrinogen-III synthase [Acidimicrobiia bacterium]
MPAVLAGFTVGITGDRRSDEQAELLRRRGAAVVHGPTIETRPLADGPELRQACESLLTEPPDLLVATTGVGIRSWMEAADGLGMGDGLRAVLAGSEVVARSPKAAGALLTAGLPLHWQAPGERTQDLLDHLAERDLTDVRVAVQRDGADEPALANELTARGARVVDVPIYRWFLPSEPAPAHRLLDALVNGHLDAITVTSSPALANLFTLAAGRTDVDAVHAALTAEVLVACVGPVCSASARAAGISRIVEPARFRLGSMVKRLTDALAATAWCL